VLVLSTACVLKREGSERAPAKPQEVQRIHVPSRIAAGCGATATTDPKDLSSDRAVARCAKGSPAPQPLPQPAVVRVGVRATTEDLAPVLLALQEGEFRKENLQVQLVPLDDPRKLFGALRQGTVDVVAGKLDAPLFDLAHDKLGAKVVLGGPIARAANDVSVPQPGLWIRADQLTSPERYKDLEDDHFAVQDGIQDAVAAPLTDVLRQDDLSLNEVHLDLVDGPAAVKELQDGKATGAWLPEPVWRSVAGDPRFRLIATLPASESISGIVFSARLIDRDRDRAVGVAFARAVIRTVNTYLADDYQRDKATMNALATATGISRKQLDATPPWLFDWELRADTTERMQTTFIGLGSVLYEEEIPERDIVDRTVYRDAIAGR
jgi:NitT/TauT family transport system substrate-binding protein